MLILRTHAHAIARILSLMRAGTSALAVVALAVLADCGQPKTPEQVATDYQARIEDVIKQYEGELLWPVCEVPPRRGKACGLLADRALAPEFIQGFVKKQCDGEDGPECLGKFRDAYMGLLRRRYPLAKPEDVDAHCVGAEEECSKLWYVELQYLKSHNAAVFSQMDAEVSALVAESKAAQADAADAQQRREAWAAALMSMGQSVQSQAGGEAGKCSSDFQCPFGSQCVKDSGAMHGVCARQVDQHGTPTYAGPDSSSTGPGKGQCSFDTQCPIGFKCVKTSGGLRGNCMK